MLITHLPAFLYLVLAPSQDWQLKDNPEGLLPLYERAAILADETRKPVHLQDSHGFTFDIIHPE